MTNFLELPDSISYQNAMSIASNKKTLASRISRSRDCLDPRYAKLFTGSTYEKLDFENRMLRSDCGTCALIWLPRYNPYLPESYDNQQTGGGCVHVIEVDTIDAHISNVVFYKSTLKRLRLEAQDPVEQVIKLFNFLEKLDEVNSE